MQPEPRGFHSIEDLLARAEEFRERAGTARTADIQDALLKLAQLYQEAADERLLATQSQPIPAELVQVIDCVATL